ncbi:MAG: phenylalanine--tRNA ligase beta subunit-related protein [Patescibacteria group bacterium]
MKVSYKWLVSYFKSEAPRADEIQRLLNFHAFEVESAEEHGDDWIYDVKVLPNRAHDCLSHIGIAKELAAITGKQLREPIFPEEKESLSIQQSKDLLALTVEDAVLVPRATKRVVLNIAVGESPLWLVERLAAIGQRSINSVVDATNYLTHELGQPVHAFDYDKLAGDAPKKIIIRHARAGEELTTLDGKKFTLDPSVLVIADSEKALDIAGIKGGNNSGIDSTTKRVVLSACNFNAVSIRKTSQKLGLRTDASVRFEHELAPELARRGIERLTQLVLELAGGEATPDIIDVAARTSLPYVVGVVPKDVNKLLGASLSEEEMVDTLARLGLAAMRVTPSARALELAPTLVGARYKLGASVRHDAPAEFDSSSFISYLHAQGGLPVPRISIDQYFFTEAIEESDLMPGDLIFTREEGVAPKTVSVEFLPGNTFSEGVSHVALYMGNGEVIHASRAEKAVVFEEYKGSANFKDIVAFRRIPGAREERLLVVVPVERLDLRAEADLIEEIGRIYGYEHVMAIEPKNHELSAVVHKKYYYAELIRSLLTKKGFSELITYSLVGEGMHLLENPIASDKRALRTEIAPAIAAKLADNIPHADLLMLPSVRIFEIGNVFGKSEKTHIALGSSSSKDNLKELLGYLGENLYSGKSNILELDFEDLIRDLPEPLSYTDIGREHISANRYEVYSPYPCVVRDIAVWVPESVSKEAVVQIIEKNAGEYLLHTRLFDEFAKKSEDGAVRRSYAYRLVFQSKERTLKGDEVQSVMDSITAELNRQDGWKVR